MLIRHASCRHNILLRRLASPSFPAALLRCPSSQIKTLGASRRLLTTRPALRPAKRKALQSSTLSLLPERTLATALGDYNSLDDLPYESLAGSRYPMYPPPRAKPLWELRGIDASAPLIISDPGDAVARQKINFRGVPGDLDEMLSVLNACLQVGKLERATLVLQRLGKLPFAKDVDMTTLHNRYLRVSLDQLMENPSLERAEAIHKWYELEIREREVPQTPETIAYMVKASLFAARGARRQMLIDRYMSMVSHEAGLEVLYMTDILNDQDRAAVTDVCQRYNLAIQEIESSIASDPTATDLAGLEAADATAAVAEGSDTPAVRVTPQKGMGLRLVKQTLGLFSEIPSGRDVAELSQQERRELQSRLERDCVDAAVEKWREENQALLKMGLNTSLSSPSLNSRLFDWYQDLERRIEKELKRVEVAETASSKNKEDMDRCLYGPLLQQSTPGRLAAVTIVGALNAMAMHGADKGVSIGIVVNQLAKAAEDDIRLQLHTKELMSRRQKSNSKRVARRAFRAAKTSLQESSSSEASPAQIGVASAPDAKEPASADMFPAWPVTIRVKLGAALLSMLMETARVTAVMEHPESGTLVSQQQPAFSRVNQVRKGKKVGMLLANPILVDLMKREPRADMLARHLPMLVEPEPWTKFDKGGFLEHPVGLIRIKDGQKDQMIYADAAIARGDMDQVLRGLDVLGRTAWKINRPVFNVMLEAWNKGEPLANIPALNPDITIPPEPEVSDDLMVRRAWLKAVKAAENERSGLHSVRCFMNFQMEIARAFRDQTFYFPHNVDFRGRAYPVPPYFNHIGADHVRGLLTFAKGKELGESGLRWLKVHLANVYGYDKASLSDRESFSMENLDNILDSVNNPLNGRRWWLKAEDPWQCLATCFELKAALDCPDPTKYVSHLPVHQDGTCNGLQHYAALGGDTWGARQVNLEPGDRPADVYSAVANIVKESIAKDAENGSAMAKALLGKITRKVVKQTVMTNVYGVTFAGAKKQVLKQLDALYPDLAAESGFPAMVLASYIAQAIFRALSTMFSGAHDIQHWLGEIGGRVCQALTPDQLDKIIDGEPETAKKAGVKAKSTKKAADDILSQFRSTLVWTTPLRMPVVQPYRKSSTRTVETCLQDLVLSFPERSDPVHMRKQLQGFPPNFIHSLDASHMLLSALECDELGLTFAAVHDSFWTHAADIDTMNRVLRDAFIRIHSEDVIGRLAAEFHARYNGSMYLAQVAAGSDAAKKILKLRKEKRVTMRDELIRERKRQELLSSSDPDRVAEGKKMVTPASIFEDTSPAEKGLLGAEDMSEFQLGNIPTRGKSPRAASASAGVDDAEMDDAIDEMSEEDDMLEAGAEAEAAEQETERSVEPVIIDNVFENKLKNVNPKKKAAKTPVRFWMPLTFPPVPAKGDFDVRRLKGSDYFFS